MLLAFLVQATNDSTKALIAKNAEEFHNYDPWGLGMAVIGIAVVFASLVLLYLMFSGVAKLLNKQPAGPKKEGKEAVPAKADLTGEINAAIATAIYLYNNELHDHEDTVLTIQRIQKTYSPWSSKIYGLRKYPRQ